MREPVRDKGRLENILEACQLLVSKKNEDTLETIKADAIRFYGYVKLVEIIGEATYKLTREYRDSHTMVPWKMMEGMRHVLVHDYYKISPEKLWETIEHDIPELIPVIERLILDY